MQRTFFTALAALALTAAATAPAHAQDINALLKDADHYRMSADNLQVETQISVFNTDGSPDKERRYTVFAQAGRKSLVLMQSPVEKGQKVLMLGDDFWLVTRYPAAGGQHGGAARCYRLGPWRGRLWTGSRGRRRGHLFDQRNRIQHAKDRSALVLPQWPAPGRMEQHGDLARLGRQLRLGP